MSQKPRLELTWIGKDIQPRLEPRILIEDPEKSYGDKNTENKLIFGDNLLALKALEQEYAGKIKCIFIDPPYNTGSAFTHYDDGIEHSLWLNLMRDRLEILRSLLSEDGSIWVTLDDNEAHYFKVMADEVFGRSNFIANVIWQKKYSPANDAIWLSDSHDHLLVFAKNKLIWRPELLPRTEQADSAYKNPDNDPRGPWKSGDYTCNKTSEERPNLYYSVINPYTGKEIWPKKTSVWRFNPDAHRKNVEDNLIWWGKDGNNSVPAFKRFRDSVKREGIVPQTIWLWNEVGHTQDGKKEQLQINPNDPFPTPKPEKLIERILQIATIQSDIVLDSFAGSGTTGATAHKMNRKWIMVELGEHCHTHIVPRLQKVIDGTDQAGISQSVEWQGGGGFKYYHLAPSLLKKDSYGNWVIEEQYNADMLAAAMAKHEGFRYQPDEMLYWKQGQSTEKDFIFTTTNFVTVEMLDRIYAEMQPEESLLVCCKSFQKVADDKYANITLKKIPKMLLGRCEFARDDYSLNIINLPTHIEDEETITDNENPEEAESPAGNGKTKKTSKMTEANKEHQMSLLGE